MRWRRVNAAVALLIAGALGACSSGGKQQGGPSTSSPSPAVTSVHGQAVGTVTETFVDHSRPTPANGSTPGSPERTLVTEIYYPAAGSAAGAAVKDAAVRRAGSPYPLVVFAHGLGEGLVFLEPILQAWAAAGYVVAAPEFPLTGPYAPGGINAADVQQQPGDISFVISELLRQSAAKGGLLAGALDPNAIAVTGHSNGGITTLGIAANTCCRDSRIKAAIVMSGMASPYANGRYDFAGAPPILFVHGPKDALIDYTNAVEAFNEARGPKGLLTLTQSDHADWLLPQSPAFAGFIKASTDFLNAYLRHDAASLAALPHDGRPGLATMDYAAAKGATLTLPVPRKPANRRAVASPTSGLRNGSVVTVRWSGFLSNQSANVVQCAGNGTGGVSTCDVLHGFILQLDADGSGSVWLPVVEGKVGSGRCDADHPCTIIVNDTALQDPGATIFIPITFAS